MANFRPMSACDREDDVVETALALFRRGWHVDDAVAAAVALDRCRVALEAACARQAARPRRARVAIVVVASLTDLLAAFFGE